MRPVLRAFFEEAALPVWVLGPVERRLLARLAFNLASEKAARLAASSEGCVQSRASEAGVRGRGVGSVAVRAVW